MVYGVMLEHQREVQIARSVSRGQNHVAFLKLANKSIMAVVKFTLPSEACTDRYIPRKGTMAVIGFRLPGQPTLKEFRCTAIAVSDIFGLPYQDGSLFCVPGVNFQFYSGFAVEIGQRPVYYPARINLRISARTAQRQVKAINKLCDPEFPLTTWKDVALNLRATQRKATNPLASHGVPKDQIQAAIDRVLSCPGHKWSDGQKTCIRAIQKFHDGLLLIQGCPGTGKTLTLAALTDIFVSLGIHVLFTTPTHYAADAACLAAEKWAHLSKAELRPLRVYRPVSENRAFRERGKDKRLQQDDGDPELDTHDQHTDCYPVIGLEHTQGQSNNLNPQDTSREDQLFMAELVAAMRVDHYQKAYGLPAKSLENRVFELAFNSDRKLFDRYPSEEQVSGSRGDLYDLIERGLLDPEGPEEGRYDR